MQVIIWLFGILFLALASGAAQTTNDGAVSLTDLVREVKVTLLQVADAAERENLPNLDSAVLEAKTSMKIAGNGKISLWVVEIGGGRNSEYASTVTLTLKPAPPGTGSDIATVRLADALTEAILSGARAIAEAKKGNPPLLADKLEASVHFAIQRDANGKVAVKFPPFEVGGGGSVTTDEIQTLAVTYKR
jgi:Trypsin-co-occurring domain 2